MTSYPEEQPKVLTVKEMDSDQQPREKALAHGVGVLSTSELLAIILRTGTTGYPITELTRDLIKANGGNLHTLERRTRKELQGFKGIGVTKAVQIEAILELIRRYMKEEIGERYKIVSAESIYDYMRPRIGNLDHEEIWVIFLNRANQVMMSNCMTKGGATSSVFDVKQVMKRALVEGAEAIVLCHNHPSGALLPSTPDDNITRACAQAAKYLDIRFLDHVIVSATGYYSYCDSGRMPRV